MYDRWARIWGRRAKSPPASPAQAVVYTRQGCHLCDDAIRLLNDFGLAVETIDIDSDDTLVAKYGQCVPVVLIDGRERFRGRIEPRLLRRLLKGRGT